jgi:MFS family permease
MPAESTPAPGALQLGVFLDELVLLIVLGVAGARLGDGGVAGTALAIALPLAAAVLWGRWLAPRARGRLDHRARLAAKLALVAAASLLLALSDLVWWGVAFLVVSAALHGAGELSERPRAT